MRDMEHIAKVEIVPVRTAFPREATNLTMWLEHNIDALSERIGLDLTVIEREKSVGSFSVDLLCEDSGGHTVIVENQLERSDHDHLGKLLTYMVNLDAHIAVWVTPEARPEHERVIDWLNESAGSDYAFYLVQIEAIRIGDSPFAPLFTIVVAPDEQIREIGDTKKELADAHVKRLEFWKQFLERGTAKSQLLANRTAGTNHWLDIAAGRTGFHFTCLILKDRAGVDLYIDVQERDRNKYAFDQLHGERESIEAEFGAPLDWRRLDERRASRVVWLIEGQGSLNEPETWPELQEVMIDALIRFDAVFRPRLRRLNV